MSLDLKVSKTSIVTAVCGGNLNQKIDLETFFKKLKINSGILGAKYHGKTRGKISSTGSFFNQVTLVVKSSITKKTVNMKIFGNGNLHFTGVKSVSHAEHALKIVIKQMIEVKGNEEIDVKIIDGIVYDKLDYDEFFHCEEKKRFDIIKIFSHPDSQNFCTQIGIRKVGEFIIHGELCSLEDDYFVSTKYSNFKKKIFNKNGCELGFYTFVPSNNRKNIVLKNRKIEKINDYEYTVFDKYHRETGKIFRTDYEGQAEAEAEAEAEAQAEAEVAKKIIGDSVAKTVNIKYRIIQDTIDSIHETVSKSNIEISNINAKIKLEFIDGNWQFDRVKMDQVFFNKYKINSYLEKESKYQGLSIKLYYNELNEVGVKDSSFCRKVSCLIFNTGTILISGCVNSEQISISKYDIVNIINDNIIDMIKTPKISVEVKDKELTIWDI